MTDWIVVSPEYQAAAIRTLSEGNYQVTSYRVEVGSLLSRTAGLGQEQTEFLAGASDVFSGVGR